MAFVTSGMIALLAAAVPGIGASSGDARIERAELQVSWGESRVHFETSWEVVVRIPDPAPTRVRVTLKKPFGDLLLIDDARPQVVEGVWRATLPGGRLDTRERHWLGTDREVEHEFVVELTAVGGEQRLTRKFSYPFESRWAALDALERTRRPPVLRQFPEAGSGREHGPAFYGLRLGQDRDDFPDSIEELLCLTPDVRESCTSTLDIRGQIGPFDGAFLPLRLAFRRGRLCGIVAAAPDAQARELLPRLTETLGPPQESEGSSQWRVGEAMVSSEAAPNVKSWSRVRIWDKACVYEQPGKLDEFPAVPASVTRGR